MRNLPHGARFFSPYGYYRHFRFHTPICSCRFQGICPHVHPRSFALPTGWGYLWQNDRNSRRGAVALHRSNRPKGEDADHLRRSPVAVYPCKARAPLLPVPHHPLRILRRIDRQKTATQNHRGRVYEERQTYLVLQGQGGGVVERGTARSLLGTGKRNNFWEDSRHAEPEWKSSELGVFKVLANIRLVNQPVLGKWHHILYAQCTKGIGCRPS